MNSPDSTVGPPDLTGSESSASASGKLKGLASGLGKGSGLFRWKVVPTPKREEPEVQMPGLTNTNTPEKRVKKVEDVSRDYEEWLRELRDKLWSAESKYKMEKVRVSQLTEQLKTEREAKEQLQQLLERDRAENSEQLQLLQAEGTRLREERDAAELIRDAAEHERNAAVRDRDAIIEDSKVLVERLEDLEVECEGLAEVSTRMHDQLQTVISERNEAREANERVTREKDRILEQLCALKRTTAAADSRTSPAERKRGRAVVAHKNMQVVVTHGASNPGSPSSNLKNIAAMRRQWQQSAHDSPTSSTPTTPSTEETPPTPKLEDVSDEGSPTTSANGVSTAAGYPSSKERANPNSKGEEGAAPPGTQGAGGEDSAPLAPSTVQKGEQKGEAREPVSATWRTRSSSSPSVYALQKTVMRLTGEKEELEQRMSAFKKEKLELVTRLRVAREAQKRLESSLRKVQPRSGSVTPEPAPPPTLSLQGASEDAAEGGEQRGLAAAAA